MSFISVAITPHILLAELSAAAVLIDYWHPNVNNALWVAICIFVVLTINMLGAGAYGEAEFIFAYALLPFVLASSNSHVVRSK